MHDMKGKRSLTRRSMRFRIVNQEKLSFHSKKRNQAQVISEHSNKRQENLRKQANES